MNQRITRHAKNRTGGYTLLFAVLTATLVLGVTVFIVSVSRKQFILATTARESTFAIYAASSGLECAAAAYARGELSTLTPEGQPRQAVLSCNGTTEASGWNDFSSNSENSLDHGKKTDRMTFALPNSSCVSIVVYDGFDDDDNHAEIIEARGYNLGDSGSDCPLASPRTVERALRLIYR